MIETSFKNLKSKNPLIHCITNYVTAGDVANSIIACGASPIMSDEPQEVMDITSICQGLYLNIGTLNKQSIQAMFAAGEKAKELNHIIVFDPVGAGASELRTKTALEIIVKLNPNVIRGNISEIKAVAFGGGSTKGVDADISDKVTSENLDDTINYLKEYAKKTDAVIAVSGEIDLVADKDKCYVIYNGHKKMSDVTGTGCMLTGILTAYICANPDDIAGSAATAFCLMGFAGETAVDNLKVGEGNVTLRNHIIDNIYCMDLDKLKRGARYEIR